MIGLLVGILTVLSANAQQDTLMYSICLKDKPRRLWNKTTTKKKKKTLPTCLCVESMWTRYGGRE